MIKLKEIDKHKDGYFIIYEMNKGVYTYNGSPKDILENLYKEDQEYKKYLKETNE